MSRSIYGACLVAVVALLSACSATTPTQTATGKAAAPLRSTVTGTPIVVGSICSCTGPSAAALGANAKISKAWAAWTNAHGGINGHPVKVITADDGANPATALKIVKRMVQRDHIQALIGETSQVDTAWENYLHGTDVAAIGGVNTPFFTDSEFFPSGATIPVLMYGAMQQAQKAGKKTFGTMYCAEVAVCSQVVPFVQIMGKLVGLKTWFSKISNVAASYAAPCLSARQAGVDALFVAAASPVVQRVATGCAQQNLKALAVSTTAAIENDWLTNKSLDGALASGYNVSAVNDTLPAMRDFHAALDSQLPGFRQSTRFGDPSLLPWAGGQLFKAAAEAGQIGPASTPKQVKAGLYRLRGETLGGIAPPLTFTPGKPAFSTCYFTIKVKDGAFVEPNGATPVCMTPTEAAQFRKALGA
jgi:branched-chain amino acid transport system substrate-binding protein